MKRLLVLLLLALSTLAFTAAYVNTAEAQRSRMQNAAASLGDAFDIPSDPACADPELVFPALLSAAKGARVNVLRTSAGYSADGRRQLTQYILLARATRLFEAFDLEEGRWLTAAETQRDGHFLSTLPDAGPGQVGVLEDFGGGDPVAIRPLRAAFAAMPVAGRYTVESSDQASLDRFLDLLAAQTTLRTGIAFASKDFMTSGPAALGRSTSAGAVLSAIQIGVVALTTLLLVYQLLYEAKRIGVMRLHGIGAARVWFAVSGRLILVFFAVSVAVSLGATTFVRDATVGFAVDVLASLARADLAMLTASLLTTAYIARVKVSDSVKNRKDTRGVFIINTIVKALLSAAVIMIGSGLLLRHAEISATQDRLGDWDRTRAYGVFYPTAVGNDLIDLQTGQPGPTAAEVYDLYPTLNRMGSLFIDATEYTPQALAQQTGPGTVRTVQVNPNYLRTYPVRDLSGHVVEVPESTMDWVVLVPAKYRDRAAQLRDYFQDQRTGGSDPPYAGERHWTGRDAPARFAQQQVRIIWTSNDQRVFSFSPNVIPAEGGAITDPIIEVLTTSNSLGSDRANMLTGTIDTALKVKLVDGSTTATLNRLSPELRRLKLDDNLTTLVTMNEYALEQVQHLRTETRQIALAAIGLGAGLLVLVAESLSLIFGRYARRFVVRRLFGVGFIRTYREFLLLFVTLWSVQYVLVLAAGWAGIHTYQASGGAGQADPVRLPDWSATAAMSTAVILIELVFSTAVLILLERRNLVKVLKGEF